MFPEASDRAATSYLEGEKVPKCRCIMTDGIGKCLCDLQTLSYRWICEGTDVWGVASGISRRGVG